MKKITRLLFLAALLSGHLLMAQQAVTSSGGEASGSGGSASISTGQVAYTTISGSGGTAAQGVQQPYEIFVLGKDDYKSITLSATVYPNPTVSSVTLRIDSAVLPESRYELFDLNGRVLTAARIREKETVITMDRLPSATYILKVYAGPRELKSFKIIKKVI